jgi:hypothetical protein
MEVLSIVHFMPPALELTPGVAIQISQHDESGLHPGRI